MGKDTGIYFEDYDCSNDVIGDQIDEILETAGMWPNLLDSKAWKWIVRLKVICLITG